MYLNQVWGCFAQCPRKRLAKEGAIFSAHSCAVYLKVVAKIN